MNARNELDVSLKNWQAVAGAAGTRVPTSQATSVTNEIEKFQKLMVHVIGVEVVEMVVVWGMFNLLIGLWTEQLDGKVSLRHLLRK